MHEVLPKNTGNLCPLRCSRADSKQSLAPAPDKPNFRVGLPWLELDSSPREAENRNIGAGSSCCTPWIHPPAATELI